MNKLNYLFILFFACTIFSCEKETLNIPPKEDNKEIEDPVLERIRAMGFDMNKVIDYNDDYYLVEEDIMIPKHETDATNQRHISFTYEFYQIRPIRIFLEDNFETTFSTTSDALDDAIIDYNNVQGAKLSMERTYNKSLADIVIYKSDRNDNKVAVAYFYYNGVRNWDCGIIGYEIRVNERKTRNYSRSQLENVLVHEIGHCIGRMHTDTTPISEYYNKGYLNISFVLGCPEDDLWSVMNGHTGGYNWNGFSHWDVVSLRRLFPAISKSNVSLMFVDRNAGHVGFISGAERYQYSPLVGRKYFSTDDNWDYCVNPKDFGLIYAIQKNNTASGKTEINSIRYIQGMRINIVTPLNQTNDNWTFTMGDFNRDGKDDMICINRYNTTENKTTIHVLNGATGFTSWLRYCVTPLGITNGNWDFTSGDVNNDGKMDVICINKQNLNANKTTIHVLDGATNYTSWLSHAVTPLHRTGANFEFFGGDYNNDGRTDVYAIKKWNTGTTSTEVHILNGANNFQNYLVQIGTSLPEVSGDVEFCN